MLMKKIRLSTPALSLYLEDDQGIVFHHRTRTLYQLSTLSVAFFLAIDEGLSQTQCITEIAELTKIPSENLNSTYQQTRTLFQSAAEDMTYLDGQYPDVKSYSGSRPLSELKHCNTYQVGGVCFAFSASDKDIFIAIEHILEPIKVQKKAIDFHIDVRLSVQGSKKGYEVFSNNLMIEESLTKEQTVPVVIDHIQVLAFQLSSYLFCFHGAALKMPLGNLWLPGKSGAGKSTLSAVLASRNYPLYSDEMIIVDRDFNMKALELPIAIKSGSWDLLATHYPELKQEESWQRLDGRRLKYVWPKHFGTMQDSCNEDPFLIYSPTYCKDSTCVHAIKNSVIETIGRLINGGYQVGVELNEQTLEEFIEFIEKAQCYRHTYNKTQQAENELARLWREYV